MQGPTQTRFAKKALSPGGKIDKNYDYTLGHFRTVFAEGKKETTVCQLYHMAHRVVTNSKV